MDIGRIELPPQQLAPSLNPVVDLARIELASRQCECRVLPLDHRPQDLILSDGVKMPRNTTLQ